MTKVSTPDVIMHRDMLWHVVLDLIDCVNMAQYSRVHDYVDGDIVVSQWAGLKFFRIITAICMFIAFFSHAHSFPCCEWKYNIDLLDESDILRVATETFSGQPAILE